MRQCHRGICAGIVLLFFQLTAFGQVQPYASHGVLDARAWNFSKKLPLNGYWNFYDKELLTPQQSLKAKRVTTYFPSLWNDTHPSGQGYATYSLLVLLPASFDTFSIEIPQLYNSYNLWVNGKLAVSNGVVGTSWEESIPQWRPQVVTYTTLTDSLHIVLQVSNFHHHKGGVREPIYLGPAESMNQYRAIAITSNHVHSVILTAAAILLLYFFLKRPKEKSIAYFALLSLVWATRSMFSNLYTITLFFPDFNWSWMVRVEYLTIYFSSIFAILFLDELFGDASNPLMKYTLVTANSLFVVITIFSPPLFFTRWLSVYLIFAVITIIYGIVFIIRAIVNDQLGVWFLVASLLLGIIIFSYDIMSYQGMFTYKPIVLNVCYLLIFLSTATALLLHQGILKSKRPRSGTMLTYGDLFKEEK